MSVSNWRVGISWYRFRDDLRDTAGGPCLMDQHCAYGDGHPDFCEVCQQVSHLVAAVWQKYLGELDSDGQGLELESELESQERRFQQLQFRELDRKSELVR